MNFAELISADIRLVILRVLAQDADYSHNEAVILELISMFGHRISQDKLRTELAWLAEQNLIRLTDIEGFQIAQLLPRGADAASGAASVPGVKRPRPGA